MRDKISLVGLGKLGLPLISCITKAGYETIGVDISENIVNAINRGECSSTEPGLAEIIKEHGGKELKATTSHLEAMQQTDVTFVLTATPSKADGTFSNEQVESALIELAKSLGEVDKDYHLFVISSTVVPTSTNDQFIPLIEKFSGKALGKDFGIAFDPDFVALGSVVNDFLKPDLIIIGESDSKAGDIVESIHKKMCLNEPKISRMSIINAEIAKVCLNTYITAKITFANMISNLCERIPGSNCDAITKGIGWDKRISPYYFSGGLAFGGTCFPRDTVAFRQIAAKYELDTPLIEAIDQVNQFQDENLLDVVLRNAKNCNARTVGVMGLAFKENTPVITQSPSIKLVQNLLHEGIDVAVYDPLASDAAKAIFEDRIAYMESEASLLEKSDLCVVALRSKHFKLAVEMYAQASPVVVLDCWRMLDVDLLPKAIDYVALGQGSEV